MPIKNATLDDLDEIHDLSVLWDEDDEKGVEFDILEDYIVTEQVLCATSDDDKIVGIIILSENTDSSMHIARFFVHPDYRDEGIGTDMLEQAVSILDESCTSAFASVAETSPALRLYERFNFKKTHKFTPPTEDYIALEREPD
tara:strand:+ start:447 stop:875 length:429 start_codon:yes stop_codon:yes gene_type:complete